MAFDMNQAWRQASGMVRANAQILAVLAGVFFFLPSFAMAIFAPVPQADPEMGNAQMMQVMSAYYSSSAGLLLLVGVAQAIGILALLALLTDRRRPTVSDALRTGAISLLPYIGAQLLLGFAVGIAMLAAIGVGMSAGSRPAGVMLGLLVAVGAVHALVKTSLVAPVVVIEQVRNPITAIARSWSLTRGNSLRLLTFYALVLLAFIVVTMLASIVIGIVTAFAMGTGGLGAAVAGVVSSAIGAVMVVYFAAIMAAVHQQLSGPSAGAIAETFE